MTHRNALPLLLLLGLLAGVVQAQPTSPQCAPSASNAPLNWWAAMGTHYQLAPEAWMGTTRSFPTPSKLSFNPDVTASKPSQITPVTGRFSGELRYYDFLGEVPRGNTAINYAEYLRQAIEQRVDLIWNLGQIHHTQISHVKLVTSNEGKYLKDLVYQCIVFANSGEFANKPIRIYWEVGNEINSWRRFGLSDHGKVPCQLDNARDYLQFYLAPCVEAIRMASMDLFGDPRHVKILLGNITFVRDPKTREFLKTILDGTVQGTHAPTLNGALGYQLVDAIGIHYTTGEREQMDYYYDQWVGSGKVAGMWNTEELGHAGLGDYDIARVSFRWLDFWARHRWSPDIARMQFWGDRKINEFRKRSDGLHALTTGYEMQMHLGAFFQDWPITALNENQQYTVCFSSPYEVYALKATRNSQKRTALLLLPEKDGRLASLIFQMPIQSKSVKAWIQSVHDERQPIDVSIRQQGQQITLVFGDRVLSSTDALLIEIQE